jgi:hypothetical protein
MRPRAGDILIVDAPRISLKRPMTIVNAAVGFFMRIFVHKYIGKNNYKVFLYAHGLPESFIPTHSAMVYESWGILKVSEALQKGATCRPFDIAYTGDRKRRTIIMRPKWKLQPSEVKLLGHVCEKYSLEPHPYHLSNFLLHIIRIWFNSWIGRKDARSEIRQYCIELTANQFNEIRPKTFGKPYQINPVEMLMRSDFEFYKINEND